MSQKFDEGPKPPALRPDVQPAAARPPTSGGTASRPSTFYSPPPSATEPETESASQGRSKAGLVYAGVAVTAVVAVVAVIGFATRKHETPPPTTPPMVVAPPVTAPPEDLKTFSVSAADRDDKATEQLKAMLATKSANPSGAAAKPDDLKAENAPALARLTSSAPTMAQELQSGRRSLYRVYLLDFLEQDGDHVELFFDGVSFGDINLKNEGASVLLPVASGTSLQIKILATADGGGGVTVGFISSLGEARTSVMQLGGFEQWQVTVP